MSENMEFERREVNKHLTDAQDKMTDQIHNLDKEVGVLDYALHSHIAATKERDDEVDGRFDKVDGRFDALMIRMDKLSATFWKGMALGVGLILLGPELLPYLKLLF